MILKLAFRNLVRMPWRTVLYFLVILLIALAVTASAFVFVACDGAGRSLDENYIFVASLVPRDSASQVSLRDLGYCLSDADVLAYQVAMTEYDSVVPSGANLYRLPEKVAPEDAEIFWMDSPACEIVAVENLSLAYPFFTGDCTITAGTGFTAAGYNGALAELLIPWWMAEKYELSVGDTVIRRYLGLNGTTENFLFFPCKVVGIYTSKNAEGADTGNYPAYFPLAVAELDYGYFATRATTTDDLMIERADFMLRDREAFSTFVMAAVENGLDLQEANLVFNNSSYDVLREELQNIDTIAALVFIVALVVGVGVFAFFTAYFGNSRRKEKEILHALGMKKCSVSAMMAAELCVIAVAAAIVGFFGGMGAADAVCGYVNETVLAEASESAVLRAADSARTDPGAMPLEREIEIEISISGGKATVPDIPVNRIKTVGEDELGISRQVFYDIDTAQNIIQEYAPWVPREVVGLTDLSQVETSISYEDLMALPDYREGRIYCFVSEEYAHELEREYIYLTPRDKTGFGMVSSVSSAIGGFLIPQSTWIVVAGTYEDNEYCSGSDILIRMEDYYRLYSELSVTDDDFRFERIGEIVKKETGEKEEEAYGDS